MKILWYGGEDPINAYYSSNFQSQGYEIVYANSAPNNYNDVLDEVVRINANRIFFTPTNHGNTYITDKIVGPVTVAQIAEKRHLHLTFFMHSNQLQSEYEEAIDQIMRQFSNVLNLRISAPLYPFGGDHDALTICRNYNYWSTEPASFTLLEDFTDIILSLMNNSEIGLYELANPGPISTIKLGLLFEQYTNDIEPSETFFRTVYDTCPIENYCKLNGLQLLTIEQSINKETNKC